MMSESSDALSLSSIYNSVVIGFVREKSDYIELLVQYVSLI